MRKTLLSVFFLVLCGCAKKTSPPQHSASKLPFDDCQDLSLFCDDELDDLPENPHVEDDSDKPSELEQE